MLEATCGTRQKAAMVERYAKKWPYPPVLVRRAVMPDGEFETVGPWVGGTWSGYCGSTFWVDDPEFHLTYDQGSTSNSLTHTTQAWHSHWVLQDSSYFPIENRAEQAFGGFRIECRQKMRHKGQCSEGPWTWDWRLPEMRENVFRRAGQLQERLVLQ